MKKAKTLFLTEAQLKAEFAKCIFCEEKPCREACPAHCSPADFIMAARLGANSDYRRSAAVIMGSNPLGGICGSVCPDTHCMKACSRRTFDRPVEIPLVQATIVERAKELGRMPAFTLAEPNGRRVAVVGAGPAGLGAAAYLAQLGYAVDIYEESRQAGGMCRLIPDARLDKRVLDSDIEFMTQLGDIRFRFGQKVVDPGQLLERGFAAVIVAVGLGNPIRLGIPGEELASDWTAFLRQPRRFKVKGGRTVVIGGGAVAVDCAITARERGAAEVWLLCLEKWSEMPLTGMERQWIGEASLSVLGRTRATAIVGEGGRVTGLRTRRVLLPKGKPFHPRWMQDDSEAAPDFMSADAVILAIGARAGLPRTDQAGVFFAGDCANGPSTVVEAVAAGKNAGGEVDAWLRGQPRPEYPKAVKSYLSMAGRKLEPVPLETSFFGRPIPSPFLLSAAPPSDGYEQMHRAYEAGWAGGVMKTAFDGVPIHIPSEYMYVLTDSTYGNCDNVSGHSLERVCREVERLVREFPDRLTMASTGGPVTGDDDHDRRGWQANTAKLERCGVMGIEYSLSCPQGGDGTKGDIVSQDAELTAKIVDWVMSVSQPDIPKLFKLTGAVTAIRPIIDAIKAVLDRYPGKKAGVTLANTFPSLAFRPAGPSGWDEGVVIGMSGEGVLPISYLTLAKVGGLGVTVSGNGGPMDYKAAADFLALGAETVQFCTVVMKYGYGIAAELHSGLSHLLEERGLKSVRELIGAALPHPVRDFMDLPSTKKVSAVDRDLCQHCGNCTRCNYLAITLDADQIPVTDPARCIGCSVCARKCFAGALHMRARTPEELAQLQEH